MLAAEHAAGWDAVDLNDERSNHPGFDIRSSQTAGAVTSYRYLEVKGRVTGATTVTVSRNEILTSLNEPDRWILALVEVVPDGGENVRYLPGPLDVSSKDNLFEVTSVNFNWTSLWARGREPSDFTQPTPERIA